MLWLMNAATRTSPSRIGFLVSHRRCFSVEQLPWCAPKDTAARRSGAKEKSNAEQVKKTLCMNEICRFQLKLSLILFHKEWNLWKAIPTYWLLWDCGGHVEKSSNWCKWRNSLAASRRPQNFQNTYWPKHFNNWEKDAGGTSQLGSRKSYETLYCFIKVIEVQRNPVCWCDIVSYWTPSS